jgi:WD40 repeat protein/serine/threonine protein kinase/class 3 adenylate cyclase
MTAGIADPHPEKAAAFFEKHRTGLVTLVFTDLVDSTALLNRLGDQAGTTFLRRRRQLVREILPSLPASEEIETAGDSFLLAFAKPSDAVRFALQIQARLRSFSRESGFPIQERIGIHLGEIVIAENETPAKAKDLYGIQLSTCARVMSLADGGQILLTRGVFDSARQVLKGEDLSGVGALSWMSHGSYLLKGIDEPVEVCEVGEAGQTAFVAPKTSEKAQRQMHADEEPVLGWRPAVGLAVPGTKWILEEKLGEGGFGEVWLGQHPQLHEERVFKFCFRADRVRSLKREVTLFRLLKERAGEHPHIVRLYEVYFDQPPFYLEEEYIAGRDLRRWSETQGGLDRISTDTRLEIMAQAAEALQTAHDAGIIHRDVKPGNILIGNRKPEGRSANLLVKLTDFGIGQVISPEALAGVTRAGFTQTIMPGDSPIPTGTQLYMAPELLTGQPASIRSDIYALGVVLYQLLVGDFHRPLATDWAGDIEDPLLRDDLRHCFSSHPSDRFAGAGQLAERLRSLPRRRLALEEQQAHMAARERAAYRRGIVRTASVACAIVALVTLLGWKVRLSELVQIRQAARIRDTTVSLTLANAVNPANSGDWFSAALWFAEAFVLDEAFQAPADARLNRQTHLMRLNSVFRQAPLLEKMWFEEGNSPGGSGLSEESFVPPGETENVGFISGGFDVDGQHVLLGSTNGYKLYSTVSGQAVGPLFGQGSMRASLCRDGRRAVTGGGAGTSLFRVWDVHSGAHLFNLKERTGYQPFRSDCTDLQFSPDGHWIAVAVSGPRGEVIIWEADSGRWRTTIAYKDAPNLSRTNLLAARFDSSGERLLTTGMDNRAVVWHWPTGQALNILTGHRSWVYSGCFAFQHTNWVVTCSFDRTARLWDLRTGQQCHQVEHESDSIQEVQFSPDDRAFATSGLDSTVRIWDSETGQLVPPILRDHGRATQVKWSPDGDHILTISWDGVGRLWRLRPEGGTIALCASDYSRDGQYAQTLEGATVQVQDVLTSNRVSGVRFAPLQIPDYCVAGSRDSLLCFSHSPGSTSAVPDQVQLWRISRSAPVGLPLAYDPHWSNCVCATSGQRFAFYSGPPHEADGGGEKGVCLWEPACAPSSRLFSFTNEDVTSVAFDPGGSRLAVASLERKSPVGRLRLLDLDGRQEPMALLRFGQEVPDVTFSADGRWLAAAQTDDSLASREALIWRLDQPATPPARLAHLDGVLCTAFSHSGQTIATGSEDQTAIIWRCSEGAWQPSLRPLHCGGQVYACAFSDNGRWLATAYRTHKAQQSRLWRSGVRIWDVTNSEPISLSLPFSERVTRLAFVSGDTHLFVEHWIPPAPPQRWIVDLATNRGEAKDFLLRAELLSAQPSFLSAWAQRSQNGTGGALSAEEALTQATGIGPLRRPLSKEDCLSLWRRLTADLAEAP